MTPIEALPSKDPGAVASASEALPDEVFALLVFQWRLPPSDIEYHLTLLPP
jgi:hypothetical protein